MAYPPNREIPTSSPEKRDSAQPRDDGPDNPKYFREMNQLVHSTSQKQKGGFLHPFADC